jgi:hypothetical protein
VATRITPPLNDTKQLVGQILTHVLQGQRVAFIVPAGQAKNYLARIRTMISRKRKALEKRGTQPKRFTLHDSIHTETHGGTRYECIVMWRSVSDSHMMTEQLEDLLNRHG